MGEAVTRTGTVVTTRVTSVTLSDTGAYFGDTHVSGSCEWNAVGG